MVSRHSSNLPSLRSAYWLVSTLLIGIGTMFAAGCGPGQQNPCDSKTCEYGVCEASSGECVNPESCMPPGASSASESADAGGLPADAGGMEGGESAPDRSCLDGYECVSGSCEVAESCDTDPPCDRGICREGVCVNEDSCVDRSDCAPGFRCGDDGKCVADPCDQVDCERGVCRGGQCVNRESCPNDTGPTPACLEEYGCARGSCEPAGEFCELRECERGRCSTEQLECVNADRCTGDADCLEGFYCDGGQCEENACDVQRTVCDRGVCDPGTGSCANPDQCDESSACLPTYACVDDECVAEDQKCGEDGCPGNMLCDYDAENLEASCAENPSLPCRDARDCSEQRVCENGDCVEPTACELDAFEPNDETGEATDYFEARSGGIVEASVCPDDTDIFEFDTTSDDDSRGRFLLDLNVDRAALGLGGLGVRVLDEEGEVWVEGTTGENGRVQIDKRLGVAQTGVFTIEISERGELNPAGVDYSLFTDIVGFDVARACQNAESVRGRTNFRDSTNLGESAAIRASCVENSDQATEKIFQFELEEKNYVDIEVEPEEGFDASVAVRRRCRVPQSEVSCAEADRQGGAEQVDAKLEAGNYYLIVQGVGSDSGGDFDVLFRRRPANCTDRDNYCLDDQSAQICSPEGQQLEERQCPFGCAFEVGECDRPKGDTCRQAIEVDTSEQFTKQVNWSTLSNQFDPGTGQCLVSDDPASDGPDSVFEVEIPADHALTAELEMQDFERGSMYLLDGCGDASSYCEKGVDSGSATEQLIYRNTTRSAQTKYLVADSESTSSGSAEVTVDVEESVCSAGSTFCRDGDVRECNEAGTELEVQQQCSVGCQTGNCLAESCNTARSLGTGGSWQLDPTNYANDFSLDSDDCAGTSLDGPDLVFEATVGPGEVLDAQLGDQGSSMNGALYLTTECSSTSSHSETCLEGTDEVVGGTENLAYRNASDAPETYYLVVDSESDASSSGQQTWSLVADITSTTCTPGEASCQDSTALSYCGEDGLSSETYNCQGGSPQCTSDSTGAYCDNPTGEVCPDPVRVQDGDSVTGDFNGSNAIELPDGDVGACSLDGATDGADSIYRVSLTQDDLLRASLSTSNSDARMYLLRDCFWDRSCQKSVEGDGGDDLLYQAPSDDTVFVVVDETGASGSESFTVDFDITRNAICIPGVQECVDSSSVAECNTDGTAYKWKLSCNQVCQDAACELNASAADSCSTAPEVGSGTLGSINMNSQSDNSSGVSSACAPDGSSGNDAVFQVQAQAGQTISATADVESFDDPVIYISKTCGGCVTGVDSGGLGDAESLSYDVPSGEGGSYHVFFDGEDGFDTGERWNIDVRVEDSN